MMKIGFFGIEDENLINFYKEKLGGHQLFFYKTELTLDLVPRQNDLEVVSVFVKCRIDPKVLEHFPNLKFIAIRSTGVDHVDLKATKDRNIAVSNVPAYGSVTVAEFTWGLILSSSRKIYQAARSVKNKYIFDNFEYEGFDLEGKTLGVIGTGKIGQNVIKMAKAFNMKVIAHDAFPNNESAKELGYEYVSLEALLSNSDVITLHVPSLPETRHMLNKDNMKKIKKGAILVNTARGDVIETAALVEALNTKILSGASVDVLEQENQLGESFEKRDEVTSMNFKLIEMDNVVVTPHTAFNTKEANARITQTTVENILGFMEGSPKNIVEVK